MNRRATSCPTVLVATSFVLLLLAHTSDGGCWGATAGMSSSEEKSSEQADPDAAPSTADASLVLDDAIEPFVPKQSPGRQDEDRLKALAMYSAARILQHEGAEADALRLYERALRYDPEAVEIAREIIPLAVRLQRSGEAIRYAVVAAELEPADPIVLGRLGEYLVETGEVQRAATLYERSLADQNSQADVAGLLLRMQLGRIEQLLGRHEKAADALAPVFEALASPEKSTLDEKSRTLLLGDPPNTYTLIGECFLSGGRADDAATAFRKANEASPNRAVLDYQLARVDAKNGKPQAALDRLDAALAARLAVESIGPYQLLAEVLDDLDRSDELIDRLEKLRADEPDNVPLAYFLAGQYLQAEKYDEAEPLFREVIEKSPTLAGYRALVEIYRKTGRNEDLLDAIATAVEKTSSLEPLGTEGEAVVGDADLVRSLVEIARRRLEEKPEAFGYSACLAMALLTLAADDYDAAGEMFNHAIEAKPAQSAGLLLSWGLALLVNDQYATAAEVFQRGIDEKAVPDANPIFYFYLAGALEMAGQTDGALAAARKAVEIQPDSPRYASRVAWVLYHAEKRDEALDAYRQLIERFDADYRSEETREVVRETKLVLSNLAVLRREMDEAEEWLEQVLDEFPDDPGAKNDLGYLWADAGKNLDRAHRMIADAIRAEPENPAYLDSLGWVLFRLGQIDEAVAALEKAAAADSDPTILDHLGDAQNAAGRLDRARDAWQRAVEGYNKMDETEKAQAIQKKLDAPHGTSAAAKQ